MGTPEPPKFPRFEAIGRPWYEVAFGADYGRVYPHRDAGEARRTLEFLVAQGLEGPVLDLGCGAGRHLVALGQIGLVAWGLDLSPDQLAACPQRGRVVRADFGRIPALPGSFRTVLSLFSSFGYLPTRAADAGVLGEVRRVLQSGGELVLDVMNARRVRAELVPESRTERGEDVILERRTLTEGGRRVRKDVVVLGPRGRSAWHEDVALYEREQLEELLVAAGLEPAGAWGDYAGATFGPASPRLILRAQAR
ncbi:MAG: methyltransferase domain-containing protein [Planctomycetota bacterium]|nr:methyltransferase domain-containing protein [Planctomycetota bacterium]